MASSSDIITASQGIFRRDPAPGDFTHYASWPTATMISDMLSKSENTNYVHPVIRLYDAVLGRRPDSLGLDYWVGVYRATPSATALASAAAGFLSSTEGQLRYPPAESNLQFVQRIYTQVLRRNGDISEYNYWSGLLNNGSWTRTRLFAHFASEPEYISAAAAGVASFQALASVGNPSAYTGILF